MTGRLWSPLIPIALLVTACGSERTLPDVGARPDAGFFRPVDAGPRDARADTGAITGADADAPLDSGLLDADPVDPDAAPMNPDAAEADATPMGPDATPMNPDAAPMNPDAAPMNPDAAPMNPDATPMNPDAAPMNPDAAADAGVADAASPDAGAPPVVQGGGLVISEILARSTSVEWVEITNTTAQSVNLANYTIGSRSRGALAVVRATSDPTGALGTAVNLAAGASLVGVANPASAANIPAVARFVIGTPGQLGADWLADGGDVVTLRSPGNGGDVVDFTAAATNPANPIGASEYPLIAEVPTQLDLPVVSAGGELGNDNGGVWCAPLFAGGTPNVANRNCNAHLISEVTYDFGSPAGGADDGYEFIELSGAAGGSLSGVFIAFVDGASRNTNGTPIAITGTRMPLDGLYVVADRAPNVTTSFIPNTDQAESIGVGTSSSLQNGPDAVQLYRQNADSSLTLLDAFGYGTLTAGIDTTRQLAFFEGNSTLDPSATAYPANFARADNQADTNDNLVDFAFLPTTTPGVRNGSPALVVQSISPRDAIAGTTATVTLSGVNFSDSMTIVFGQTPAPTISNQAVTVSNQLTARVTYPAGGTRAAERVSVTLNGRVEFGRTFTQNGGFTWTTANNETGVADEADFANLQFPAVLTVAPGATTAEVYGRIFEAGRTDVTSGGPAPNILADVGFGAAGTDPRTRNWTWTRATFNVEVGNDDEFRATMIAPTTAGTYAYTYRFSLDGGLTWTYADLDGVGSNAGLTFTAASVGVLTVQ